MKRSGHKPLATALLCMVLLGGPPTRGGCENFGTGIKILNSEKPYTGDFNGDGITDNLFLLQLSENSKVSDDATLANPWSPEGHVQHPAESLAFGIVHGGKDGNKTVLYDPDFLSTPIWKEDPLPVSVLKKGTRDHLNWKKDAPDLGNDAVILGTEAGIDILLYRKGKNYVIFWPEEEP